MCLLLTVFLLLLWGCFFFTKVGVRGGSGGGGTGGPGVVSINGWEFGEDPLEQLYSMAQASARNSFSAYGAGAASALRGFGSPRLAEDRRSGGGKNSFEVLASRVGVDTARADGLLLLWMPLRLLVPQYSASPADKMCQVPNAFEMDAVVWKPGPFAPETDPGSGWLITARVAALDAPNDLLRWVQRVGRWRATHHFLKVAMFGCLAYFFFSVAVCARKEFARVTEHKHGMHGMACLLCL